MKKQGLKICLQSLLKNFIDNFEVKGSVFNFFDKSDDDPALKNTIPTDYPQPGKSFFIELRYQF
jgi:outer membrane receptor for ferrienterochelin and colicin